MTTSDRLKYLMNERNLKQADILDLCKPFCIKYDVKMNKSDISQYISGKNVPSQKKLVVLGLALNVTESWLMGFDVPKDREFVVSNPQNNSLSSIEISVIEKYRLLDEYGQEAVSKLIEIELNRCTTQKSKILRQIPIADFPLSAGSGNLLLDNTYSMIEVDGNEYPDADIAFRVKGDSMQPKYNNGDIVYIHKQIQINIGEIGAFLVDDMQYIKQLKKDNDGYYLHSLNPHYDDIRIVGDVICYGRVIN